MALINKFIPSIIKLIGTFTILNKPPKTFSKTSFTPLTTGVNAFNATTKTLLITLAIEVITDIIGCNTVVVTNANKSNKGFKIGNIALISGNSAGNNA